MHKRIQTLKTIKESSDAALGGNRNALAHVESAFHVTTESQRERAVESYVLNLLRTLKMLKLVAIIKVLRL